MRAASPRAIRANAQRGTGSNIAYAAAKGALNTLTMSLARALAPEVRVVAVSPGFTDTGINRARDPQVTARLVAGLPLERKARPEEMAAMILAVVGPVAFCNGVVLVVDGGASRV